MASLKDSLGRTIDYLRISVTDRCNLRCIYCMPESGVSCISHSEILRSEEIARIVRVAADMGISRVRLTGGEPLVRKGIVNLVQAIAQTPGIQDVSLTTNGILLPSMAADLRKAGLCRVNISLDTLDAQQYKFVTRLGNLEDARAGVSAALDAGFDPVKINVVSVRSLQQNYYEFAKLSLDKPLHVRFIEYMPVGESSGGTGCGWGHGDVISCEEIRTMISICAAQEGQALLQPISDDDKPYGAGPATYWAFPHAQGTVGFISAMSNHFCSECNRIRLTADGRIRPCLFSDDEYSIREVVRTGTDNELREALANAILKKPDENHNTIGTVRKMSQIGG